MTESTDRVLASIDETLDGYVSWDPHTSADAMRWRPERPERHVGRVYSAPAGTLDSGPSAWTELGYLTDEGGHEVFQSDWCQATPAVWGNRWPNAWAEDRERLAYVPTIDPERARRALEGFRLTIVPQFEQIKRAFAEIARVVKRAVEANHPQLAIIQYGDDYRRHYRSCRLCNLAGNPKPLTVNGAEYRRRTRARRRRNRR